MDGAIETDGTIAPRVSHSSGDNGIRVVVRCSWSSRYRTMLATAPQSGLVPKLRQFEFLHPVSFSIEKLFNRREHRMVPDQAHPSLRQIIPHEVAGADCRIAIAQAVVSDV